jgi:hypothetical protein
MPPFFCCLFRRIAQNMVAKRLRDGMSIDLAAERPHAIDPSPPAAEGKGNARGASDDGLSLCRPA